MSETINPEVLKPSRPKPTDKITTDIDLVILLMAKTLYIPILLNQ